MSADTPATAIAIFVTLDVINTTDITAITICTASSVNITTTATITGTTYVIEDATATVREKYWNMGGKKHL